jgi:heat shock protein HtpX
MWEAIRANRRRSVLLIVGLACVLIGMGYAVGIYVDPAGGPAGVVAALVLWLALTVVAFAGGKGVLLSSVGAREIAHDDHPVLANVVEEMTIAAGLPKPPRTFIVDSDAPNAFAVGAPGNAAVAVTTGLLMRLNRDELQGVVAHEIGHIANRDTRYMTLAGVMVAAIVLIADAFMRSLRFGGGRSRRRGRDGGAQGVIVLIALLFALLAPIIAQLLYLACSRRREYLADACSARFTRYPEGLASALAKISGASAQLRKVNRAVAPMLTVNPLKGSAAHSIFSTHPPTEKRIRVLRAMGGAGYADYEKAYAGTLGGSIVGVHTLAGAEAVAVREPSAEPEATDLEKAREAVDILHRLDGLIFLQCVCGLKTKVPEDYEGDSVRCPRCSRTIPVPTAALAAAAVAAGLGADADAGAGAGTAGPGADPRADEESLVVRYEPGRWQSARCRCGKTLQLSPALVADEVRCRSCGRTLRVERA